jgi:phosphoglycolate phosphatase-like HAD superfamily hydrolase
VVIRNIKKNVLPLEKILLISDLDDTLTSSIPIYDRVLKDVFKKNFPKNDFSSFTLKKFKYDGQDIVKNLREMTAAYGVSSKDYEQSKSLLINDAITDFSNRLRSGEKVVVLPGVNEFLEKLSTNSNIKKILLTGNPRPIAEMILTSVSLDHHFDIILGGENGIDKESNLNNALSLSSIFFDGHTLKVVLLGDSPIEAKLAKKFGFVFIGVATGSHSKKELAEIGAGKIFSNLSRVDEIITEVLKT